MDTWSGGYCLECRPGADPSTALNWFCDCRWDVYPLTLSCFICDTGMMISLSSPVLRFTWALYAEKVKVAQLCPILCSPWTIQSMEFSRPEYWSRASLVAQLIKNPPAIWETWVQSLDWISPGEEKGYPLQYSGLKNSMDCIGHEVTKSWTWLSDFHFTSRAICGQNPYNLWQIVKLSLSISCRHCIKEHVPTMPSMVIMQK